MMLIPLALIVNTLIFCVLLIATFDTALDYEGYEKNVKPVTKNFVAVTSVIAFLLIMLNLLSLQSWILT